MAGNPILMRIVTNQYIHKISCAGSDILDSASWYARVEKCRRLNKAKRRPNSLWQRGVTKHVSGIHGVKHPPWLLPTLWVKLISLEHVGFAPMFAWFSGWVILNWQANVGSNLLRPSGVSFLPAVCDTRSLFHKIIIVRISWVAHFLTNDNQYRLNSS